ncbi:MAG: hypothetical protein WA804_20275 [Terriglobales bacterium]
MSRIATSVGAVEIRRRYEYLTLERQRLFVVWMVELFARAEAQGISLEPLTDFEVEWMERVL